MKKILTPFVFDDNDFIQYRIITHKNGSKKLICDGTWRFNCTFDEEKHEKIIKAKSVQRALKYFEMDNYSQKIKVKFLKGSVETNWFTGEVAEVMKNKFVQLIIELNALTREI